MPAPLFQPQIYSNLSEDAVVQAIRQDGFEPLKIHDPAGRVYPQHSHATIKLLAFLEGGMEVQVDGEVYARTAGDRLVIPGNAQHAAVVGADGSTFFWSETLRP